MEYKRRGSGRVGGSAIVNGRGHGNQRKGGRGHGSRENRDLGTRLPNRSSRSKILAIGLSHVGFGDERQRCSDELCMRRFRAHYGIGPSAIKALIADLKRYQPDKPVHLSSLFMAICWLRLYDTEEVMAGRWGFGEQQCREKVRDYVSRIQALKPMKIKFDD